MKITKLEAKRSKYNQISQDIAVLFSFVNETAEGDFNLLHQPFKCRDYFNECVMGNKERKSYSIYGFSFDSRKHFLDKDHTKLYLEFDKGFSNLKKNLFVLRDFELSLGRSFTKLIDSEESEKEIILIADKSWQDTCLGLNIYTLLLKCILGLPEDTFYRDIDSLLKDASELKTNEGSYVKIFFDMLAKYTDVTCEEVLRWMISNSGLINYSLVAASDRTHNLHNSSGIRSISAVIRDNLSCSLFLSYRHLDPFVSKFNEHFNNRRTK